MPLDQKAANLQSLVQIILQQFQSVHAAAANGPHVELNMHELRTVEFLGHEGPRMMRELADNLAVAVNSMTTIVDHLETKSLVRRQRSDADRRVVRVELTPAGRDVFQSLVAANLELFRNMLGALTEAEQDQFLVLFRKIAQTEHAATAATA